MSEAYPGRGQAEDAFFFSYLGCTFRVGGSIFPSPWAQSVITFKEDQQYSSLWWTKRGWFTKRVTNIYWINCVKSSFLCRGKFQCLLKYIAMLTQAFVCNSGMVGAKQYIPTHAIAQLKKNEQSVEKPLFVCVWTLKNSNDGDNSATANMHMIIDC